MTESTNQNPTDDPNSSSDSERTKQVTVAGWTAGVSAFFAVGAVAAAPTWPVAIGVSSVSAMVAVVCYFILKR